jgi:hypothetical protein
MGFEIRWLVPNRIVGVLVSSRLSNEEALAMNNAIRDHINAGEAPVHLIMDMRQVEVGGNKVSDAKQFFIKDKSPNLGWTVLISKNKMVRFFSTIIMQAANLRVRMTETPEDALNFIAQLEPQLGDLHEALAIANEVAKTP